MRMPITLHRLTDPAPADLVGLTDVLLDVVDGGASVGFMSPLSRAEAATFWDRIATEVRAGDRALLAARDDGGRIVGTVQLILGMPPNQPHRAELAKLQVHRDARRQGAAEALMRAAESTALAEGKWLLLLDTADATAERLYTRLGWIRVGVVPDFALLPGGGLCDTVFFYKSLRT